MMNMVHHLISWKIEGVLTKKQKQVFKNMHGIITTFYDRSNKKCTLTWNDLVKKTGLSKGALSKHLKELRRQGVIRRIVEIHEDKVRIFHEYTGKSFLIKGKIPPGEIPGNVCRVWFNDKGIIVKGQWGYMKKGRGNSRYFVPSRSHA